jgi:hypothetical protein
LRSKLYYYSWYYLGRFIAPKKEVNGTIEGYADYFIFNLKWASFFGLDVVFIGDSNVEVAKDTETAEKWKPLIAVNTGKAGSRVDDWTQFFTTEKGKIFLKLILDNAKVVVSNIGGNNVLQDRMDVLEEGMEEYCKAFFSVPHLGINIPPIHLKFFPNARGMKTKVNKANKIIAKAFSGDDRFLVDLHTPLKDPETEEAYLGILSDPVHYSDWTDRVFRIPLLREMVKKLIQDSFED